MRLFENRTYWVLKYKDGAIVALTAEGYPYPAKWPKEIYTWSDAEEALRYAAHFKDELEQKTYELFMEVSD